MFLFNVWKEIYSSKSVKITVQNLTSGTQEGSQEQQKTTCYLVKEVLDHNSRPDIIPMPMNKQDSPKEPKSCNGIITCSHSLPSFFAHHTNANMCLLDHTTIIRTITNC